MMTTESAMTLVHYCNACRREEREPAPATYTMTLPAPPWYCARERCQDAKTRGLIYGYAIRPAGEGAWLLGETLQDAELHFVSGEDDDEWELKRVAMTRAQWDSLPEHGGW